MIWLFAGLVVSFAVSMWFEREGSAGAVVPMVIAICFMVAMVLKVCVVP